MSTEVYSKINRICNEIHNLSLKLEDAELMILCKSLATEMEKIINEILGDF